MILKTRERNIAGKNRAFIRSIQRISIRSGILHKIPLKRETVRSHSLNPHVRLGKDISGSLRPRLFCGAAGSCIKHCQSHRHYSDNIFHHILYSTVTSNVFFMAVPSETVIFTDPGLIPLIVMMPPESDTSTYPGADTL